MSILSNFYRILYNCEITGLSTDENTSQQSVMFNLNEFINDSNDEIYHALHYKLTFDHSSYDKLFKAQHLPIPELKIIVVHVGHLDRDTMEHVIGYDCNGNNGIITLLIDGGEKEYLSLNTSDEYDGKIIQVYGIDEFFHKLNHTIDIDNHWITGVFCHPETNSSLITDTTFIKTYNVKLTA